MKTNDSFPTPSELMRAKRPYLYSDSSVTDAYDLSRSEFSHYLETLTDRNQHKDFENFARRLCEREICPNLRPQTGPEGGGDGKVDTETYPVASEISDRWYVGSANSAKDRWGFAISAKKQWSGKVRSDVEGMVGTGRKYDRIYFVTSRPARAKDALRIETELLEKFGVPVTILDREWVIEKTLNNQHKDLAFNILGAGRHDPEKLELGPKDIERRRQLDNLEKSLATSGTKTKDLNAAISDALSAAYLSRELEVPRFETESKFQRAIKLAEKHGNQGHVLRALYECAWTMLWWFDDISKINEDYETVETLAFESGLAEDTSRVCNLYQVLIGRCKQGWETAEEVQVEVRGNRLQTQLEMISQNTSLPNNALYGEALLELHRLTSLTPENTSNETESIWENLTKIVDRATGMGEFPAEMLDGVIDALSPFISDSTTFDTLLERLAEFMGNRKRDGKAGSIYLTRGRQKIENEQPIEAIGWLGKASLHFMKEEYREEQFESLLLLSAAYRAAGLLWAARTTTLAALVQINALSGQEGEQRQELIPTILLFARTSLELARIPEFLFAIMWLRSLLNSLDLSAEGEEHLKEELQNLDQIFSCLIAILPQKIIGQLDKAPDILDRLEMFFSRMILMYRLGHAKHLVKDGSLPDENAIKELGGIAEMLISQPAAFSLRENAKHADGEPLEIRTIVLGVEIIATGPEQMGMLLCETHLAALEAFAATALKHGAMPIAKRLRIQFEITERRESPDINFDPEHMQLTISWPTNWQITDVEIHGEISNYMLSFCASAFSAIATLAGDFRGFENMVDNELSLSRAISFCNASHSHHRIFGTYSSKLDDLSFLVGQSYPEQNVPSEPLIQKAARPINSTKDTESEGFKNPSRHDNIKVHSVINTHLWDRAEWMGILYASFGNSTPPVLALGFKNGEMGKAIFREWRREFESFDIEDIIRISILQGINKKDVHHYRAHITRSRGSIDKDEAMEKAIWQLSRMQTMEPPDSKNLDWFLEDYSRAGCYLLAPAEMTEGGETIIHKDLAILKKDLHVKDAWSVGPDDEEMMGIREEDDILVPSGIENPPCEKVKALKRDLPRRK